MQWRRCVAVKPSHPTNKLIWLGTLSQFLIAQHHMQRYKISITAEYSPALLFKRCSATAPCLGVIICFQRRGVGETADLQRGIQMDLLLMNSKVHLTKRKFKHETKIEKVGVLCFCLHIVLKMSISTESTPQLLVITIDNIISVLFWQAYHTSPFADIENITIS